ncbi:MAG: SRPBCC domain-containing protein [Bacteroidales bacterium]|nr:SRPBCC domain-containing protein [Bacteroidales bacterium]HPD96207.1 START-like domain-containing protein [Tenuifilaceae bacterium]HRX31804.1 START-like domain-containing protein [Tenuifilaceae bacterium]
MKEEVDDITRVELEFSVNTSPNILFQRLCTPHGLSEWFADDVNLSGKTFTFIWKGTSRQAELVELKVNKYVKFQWIDDDSNASFSFKISTDDITGDISLIVIEDIDDPEEEEEVKTLWLHQVNELKRAIGA